MHPYLKDRKKWVRTGGSGARGAFDEKWAGGQMGRGRGQKIGILGRGYPPKQGKSEGFDSCDRPSNLTHTGFKSSIFQPV